MIMSYRTFKIHDRIREGTKEFSEEIAKLREHTESDKKEMERLDKEIVSLADELSKTSSLQDLAKEVGKRCSVSSVIAT